MWQGTLLLSGWLEVRGNGYLRPVLIILGQSPTALLKKTLEILEDKSVLLTPVKFASVRN